MLNARRGLRRDLKGRPSRNFALNLRSHTARVENTHSLKLTERIAVVQIGRQERNLKRPHKRQC